jgi:hypothetical protein
MSDNNTPQSPNGWHINEQLVPRLRIGMRGTEANCIEMVFDATGLLPDGAASLRESMRQALAEKLREDAVVARFITLRNNARDARRMAAEAQIRREKAAIRHRELLLQNMSPQLVEDLSAIGRERIEADGNVASYTGAAQQMEKETDRAQNQADRRLDLELQRLSAAAMERVSEEIPKLAAAVAAAAAPYLDALAVGLQQLRYAASMTPTLRADFDDLLQTIEPSVVPTPLDALPADTPQEPPAEIRRRVPAAVAAGGVPSMYVQQFEHVPMQVEFEAEPTEPAVAVVEPAEPASEPAKPAVAEASSEQAEQAEPRPRRRGK